MLVLAYRLGRVGLELKGHHKGDGKVGLAKGAGAGQNLDGDGGGHGNGVAALVGAGDVRKEALESCGGGRGGWGV